jgi:PmbA protein
VKRRLQDLIPAQAEALFDAVLSPLRAAGASGRASLSCADDWEVGLASGAIESVEASRSQGLSLRVFFDDGRSASASSNDLTPATLRRMAEDCVALARAGAADPWNGLPEPAACGQAPVTGLCDEAAGFDRAQALAAALEADRIVRADRRIIATHRGGVGSHLGYWRLRDTNGLDLHSFASRYQMGVLAVAQQGEERQTGWDATSARNHRDLRRPEAIAALAVQRATEGFGWRKAPSGPCRVIFDHRIASEFLGLVGSLCSGQAIYRNSSCWAEALGQQVAASAVSVIDDPGIAGASGSRPCDGEGVLARPLRIIEGGVLRSWLTDSYSARRLAMPLTGHAGGTSNLFLEPGTMDRETMLRELGRGLLVTGLHGWGVDTASGQWSRGAQGFWVEGGSIAHPVQEVTLAGRIQDLFLGIQAIGDDPKPEGSTRSPSLLIEGLTLGGE